jgi:hypothetical protein
MFTWVGVVVLVLVVLQQFITERYGHWWYAKMAPASPREVWLQQQLPALKVEAKRLNTVDTFVQYARATRTITAYEKELEKLGKARADAYEQASPHFRQVVRLLQDKLLPLCCYIFFHDYLFATLCPVGDDRSCWVFGGGWFAGFWAVLFAWPLSPERSGAVPYGSVGVLVWLILCNATASSLAPWLNRQLTKLSSSPSSSASASRSRPTH